jgi:hypothetical protein
MTSQSPRIYLYKITFEEVPYYYYGIHKETLFGEEYLGSPKTNKWCWELYNPKKQILEIFPFTDEGWLEANKVEQRLIKPVFNTDKWCLNESCAGTLSIEQTRKAGRKGGKKIVELKLGIHSLTKEETIENAKKGGAKVKELGVGICGLTKEQRQETARQSLLIRRKLKVGIHSLTTEQLSETGKKVASQRWECLETGFITNAGNLTKYQKARGIDTSKRKKIS